MYPSVHVIRVYGSGSWTTMEYSLLTNSNWLCTVPLTPDRSGTWSVQFSYTLKQLQWTCWDALNLKDDPK